MEPFLQDEIDRQFARRLHGGISTVREWDKDPALLKECRDTIPFDDLRDDGGPYSEPKDRFLTTDVKFVQRLARYFKSSMTWVNQPPCVVCHSNEHMESKGTRGPVTDEEKEGGASRVEVYACRNADAGCDGTVETTFPRYNSPRKLLQTRRGRCGEYANLFGLYCRSSGLETR